MDGIRSIMTSFFLLKVKSYQYLVTVLNWLFESIITNNSLNYDFEYTKTNQFKIIVELSIIDVDQKLSLSISHGWQIDNHISDHRLLGGKWF